jgi:ABC-type branched-subunit amino acid transport system ATPase component
MSDNNIRLSVKGVNKRFGGLQALSEVGLEIKAGEIYGLIGPNGAGKTTFFNVITGLYTPDSGDFRLDGEPYTPTAVYQVAKAGIARTFQNIRLFGGMTALENVMVGRHVRTACSAPYSRRRLSARKSARSRNARLNCWSMSACCNTRTTPRATCRMATSVVWKLPVRWQPIRSCWHWTNRPPA